MRISFKNFWGETFMLFPNINFWSDDDPEYAPHKYMIFFGWLFWGVRIYFGTCTQSDQESEPLISNRLYRVTTVYNKLLNEKRFALVRGYGFFEHFLNKDDMLFLDREGHLRLVDLPVYFVNQEIKLNKQFNVLTWNDMTDAFKMKAIVNQAISDGDEDVWKALNLPEPTQVVERTE